MPSPLLFPVKLENEVIFVLDETKIPYSEEYIEVRRFEDALLVVKNMKTRSLGQVLLFFYSCVLFSDKFSVDYISRKFKDQRPTFDFLLLGEILKGQIKQGMPKQEAVRKFICGFDAMRKKRAKNLAGMLPNPANILTICNVNGELVYLYEELKLLDKKAFFYVSETRPYLQGARLTFWELRKNNLPCKIICDNQAAALMAEGRVSCVITGADRATKKGDIINKAGTYPLARLAKYFNIPFYALTQYPRDINVDSIEIEERPQEEAFMYLDGNFSGMEAFYPAFDVTRSEFVSRCLELGGNIEAGKY